ncbi:MAG TPA: ABC transporter substrate-binding protein [Devosiaceae bacterium]
MNAIVALIGLAALLASAGPAVAEETLFPSTGQETGRLVIESVTDLPAIAPLIHAFQAGRPGVAIVYHELTTNALTAHVKEACDTDSFVADLVVSSSIDQQVKLVNDGCARKVGAEALGRLPDWARWRNELFGLTFEPAVIVYNRKLLSPSEVPANRFDLIDLLRDTDRFSGRVGTYDIEASGVGYLFAFEDSGQAGTFGRLAESFGRNNVQLFCCTSDILDRVSDGRLLLGYNVLGSYAIARAATDGNLGVVMPSDYTLVLARAAFVPRVARAPELAEAFMVFALSRTGEQILRGDARLLSPVNGPSDLKASMAPESFDPQILRPITLSPALMVGLDAAKRRIFLAQWRDAIAAQRSAD